MNKDLREKYRQGYIDSEYHAQDELDKTIITLSGGAFAVTFAFIDNFIEGEPVLVWVLISCWILWGISILLSLSSYYFSTLAFRKAIEEIDEEKDFDEIDPGGYYATILKFLNPAALASFALGLILIAIFVNKNI